MINFNKIKKRGGTNEYHEHCKNIALIIAQSPTLKYDYETRNSIMQKINIYLNVVGVPLEENNH